MQQEAINILPSPAMSSRVNNFIGCKINQCNPKLNKFNFARRETIPTTTQSPGVRNEYVIEETLSIIVVMIYTRVINLAR